MVDFAEHRKALLCNDAASIADYSSAMDQATKAVAAWLQNDKMYTGGSIKELRSAIAFNPSKEGLGVLIHALREVIGSDQKNGVICNAKSHT
jgi:L-2,4-diaminobutyrate decarboxylase